MTPRPTLVVLVVACLLLVGCGSDATDEPAGAAEPAATSTPAGTDSTTSDAPDSSDAPVTEETVAEAPEPGTATAVGTADENSAFPDIIAARATREDAGTWRFDVTVSSPYDTPERYADAWRVLDPSGTELGIRILTHDHASEQPFTRSQGGISIPDDVAMVTIEGRDLANGWGGGTLDVTLP